MTEDSKPVKSNRMTVTKLGHKVDEISEVLDIMHNEIQQLRSDLTTLVEIQKELLGLKKKTESDKQPKDSGFKGMFG